MSRFKAIPLVLMAGLAVIVSLVSGIISGEFTATMAAAEGSTCNGALPAGTVVGMAATNDDGGYWIANGRGLVVACGDAANDGELSSPPNRPVVGIASTSDGGGYFTVASDGGLFAFGDAKYDGSMGGQPLNQPVVAMTVDPVTGGYWLVASDGGLFAFTAPFYGSMGGQPLNAPIVGMAAFPTGNGYYEVASDGGIFTFVQPGTPDAFKGSMGGQHLNQPIVGMAIDQSTGGYWLVASDGGIFSFTAPFDGSMGGQHLDEPIVGMEANSTGSGYRFVASDGGVFDFGTSGFFGSAVAPPLPLITGSNPAPQAATCSITLSDSSPVDGEEETATVRSNQANSSVTLKKTYKTVTSYDNGETNSAGNATINFNISGATVGFTVRVTATVGGASCSTSFTPR